MTLNKDIFRLEHIIDSIVKIEQLVQILGNYPNFEEKWIEQDSVIRNFKIIGETSSHISKELKENHLDIAWKEIRGMRNFMSHEYFGLQLDTIWTSAVHDIPILKKQIQKILHDLEA